MAIAEGSDSAALRAYLRGALALQDLVLPDEAIVRIEEQFGRVAQIARAFIDEPIDADTEPAAHFRPSC